MKKNRFFLKKKKSRQANLNESNLNAKALFRRLKTLEFRRFNYILFSLMTNHCLRCSRRFLLKGPCNFCTRIQCLQGREQHSQERLSKKIRSFISDERIKS